MDELFDINQKTNYDSTLLDSVIQQLIHTETFRYAD